MNKSKKYSPYNDILDPFYKQFKKTDSNLSLEFTTDFITQHVIKVFGAIPQYYTNDLLRRQDKTTRQLHENVNHKYISLLSKIIKDAQLSRTSSKRLQAYCQLLMTMEELAITGIYTIDESMNRHIQNYVDHEKKYNNNTSMLKSITKDNGTISNTKAITIIQHELSKRSNKSKSTSK